MKKYAFVLLLIMAPVILYVAVSVYTHALLGLDEFYSVSGSAKMLPVRQRDGVVLAGKYTMHTKSDVYCVSIGSYPKPVIVGKRTYDLLAQPGALSVPITIYVDDTTENDPFAEAVEMQQQGIVLYPKSEWVRQEVISAVLMALLASLFLIYGLKLMFRFRKERKEEHNFRKTYGYYNRQT